MKLTSILSVTGLSSVAAPVLAHGDHGSMMIAQMVRSCVYRRALTSHAWCSCLFFRADRSCREKELIPNV